MNFHDDLPLFYADFGVEAVWDGKTNLVIFNNPFVAQLDVASHNPVARAQLAEFAGVQKGQLIVIEGTTYKIQSVETDAPKGELYLQLGKRA